MGMGSSQAGTTTTTNAPYAPYLPYIGTGLGQAANLLQQGGPNYYPGQQVASFNPVQNQAFGNTNALDNTLASGSGNPYETSMFDQAARATQGQLASQFAGSGRNLDASMPLRSDQLNNLATSFFGNNYQNSVNNAFNATNQQRDIGNQIQNQGQNEINASMNAYNFGQNQPYNNLQRFMSTITGLQGSSQSQPYFQNQGANMLGGLLAGQQLYNGMGSKPGNTGYGIGSTDQLVNSSSLNSPMTPVYMQGSGG